MLVELGTILGVFFPALLISRLGVWLSCVLSFLLVDILCIWAFFGFFSFFGFFGPRVAHAVLSWGLRSSEPRGWLCVLFVFCVFGHFWQVATVRYTMISETLIVHGWEMALHSL